MEISIKNVIASAVLAGAGLAGAGAHADTYLPDTGNGELVLYVRNTVTDNVYARGLGVRLDSVMSQSTIQGISYTGNVAQNYSYSLPTLGPDTNLNNFLGAGPTSQFQWAILAGDSTGDVANVADLRFLSTTLSNVTGANQASPNNSQIVSLYTGLQANTQVPANGAINSGALGDKASGSLVGGIWTPSASPNAQFWYGANLNNVVGLDQVAKLYVFASRSDAPTQKSEAFRLTDVQLTAGGVLQSVGAAPVPLPAAVWLFGSGLLGLAGIGRRRK